jgi:GntR family transcriptional regulator
VTSWHEFSNLDYDFEVDAANIVIYLYDNRLLGQVGFLIRINYSSGIPLYRQVMDQIRSLAATGGINPGDQLPTIRELAEQLRINRNTIAKVYSLLEQEGVVESRHGSGVFLPDNQNTYKAKIRNSILDEAVDSAVVQALQFQVDQDAFLTRVRKRWEILSSKQAKPAKKGGRDS